VAVEFRDDLNGGMNRNGSMLLCGRAAAKAISPNDPFFMGSAPSS
jgi:hypothetical protein